MTILLDTPFQLGDIIKHITDTESEVLYVVIGYCIHLYDSTGVVLSYTVAGSTMDSVVNYFKPYEIEITKKVEK